MIVNVTHEHINCSIPRNCEFCVIATALKEATGITWEVMSDNYGYTAYSADHKHHISLPTNACAVITTFDKGLVVEPFSFEFDYNPMVS